MQTLSSGSYGRSRADLFWTYLTLVGGSNYSCSPDEVSGILGGLRIRKVEDPAISYLVGIFTLLVPC